MAANYSNLGVQPSGSGVTNNAIGTGTYPNWGSTFSGDLVTKVNFANYVREQLYGACAFVQSGIIQRNTFLDMSSGGTRITVPFVKPFLANEERIESNTTWGESGKGYLSVQKINADSQVAAVMHRGWAFGADDLSALSSGIDPMQAIASYIADNAVRNRTATLVAMLEGVLGALTAAGTSHTVDKSQNTSGATEANFLSAANVIAATNVLGENSRNITSIAMHSHVYNYLKTIGMLTFSTSALATGGAVAWGGSGVGIASNEVAEFAGYRVVVDDKLAPTINAGGADQYPCYLFGPGSVQLGVQRDFRIEYDRQILSKQDVASVDYHELLHIDGVSYGGTDNPANSTLSTAGSWSIKYDDKFVNVVKLIVNSPFAANA